MKFRNESTDKLYAFALASVFVLVLAGCGGGGGTATTGPPVMPAPTPSTDDEKFAARLARTNALTARDAALTAVGASVTAAEAAKAAGMHVHVLRLFKAANGAHVMDVATTPANERGGDPFLCVGTDRDRFLQMKVSWRPIF